MGKQNLLRFGKIFLAANTFMLILIGVVSGITALKSFWIESKSYAIFALIGCIIISLLIQFLWKPLINSIPGYANSKRNKINQEIKEIKRIIKKLHEKDDEYALSLFLWRIRVEKEKLKEIDIGKWSPRALKTYDYIRYIFGSVLSILSKGDTYNTLSNLNFWSEDKMGGSNFMEMNTAACDKGVNIQRIIVLDNSIFNQPKLHKEEINKLEKLIQEINIAIEGSPKSYSNIENHFFISSNYKKDGSFPVPYALITNDNNDQYISIKPIFPEEKKKNKSNNKGKENKEKVKDLNPEIKIEINSINSNKFLEDKKKYDTIYERKKELLSLQEIKDKIDQLKKTP